MTSRVSALDRSWRNLLHAERVLTAYYDTNVAVGNQLSLSPISFPRNPTGRIRKKTGVTYFGGILNNRNDPRKRPNQGISPKTKSSHFDPTTRTRDFCARESQEPNEELTGALVCRSLYRETHTALGIGRRTVRPTAKFGTMNKDSTNADFNELMLIPKTVKLKAKLESRAQMRKMVVRKSAKPIYDTKGLDTGSEVSFSPKSSSGNLESLSPSPISPFTVQKCTPASLFLDHMVRQQAYRKSRQIRSAAHINKARSPPPAFRNAEIRRSAEPRGEKLNNLLQIERKSIRAVVNIPSFGVLEDV